MNKDLTNLVTPLLPQILKMLGKEPSSWQLTQLQGEASYRVYFRLSLATGESFIVMKMPEGKASASEEITNLDEKPTEIPFLNIQRFLAARSLPVPAVHYADPVQGILLLEDLGDSSLEKMVLNTAEPLQQSWYEKAIDLLIDFQKKTNDRDENCIAYRRSFDPTLLNWEFDHFIEYGIEERTGSKISSSDLNLMHQEMHAITDRLVAMPQVLVHRDFQSRNLMIQGDSLRLIDFQDALLGPLPYDLVALLRDSYISLSKQLLSLLIKYYWQKRSKLFGDKTTLEEFHAWFDLMTIQRKLKDAGRFVYIDRVKKNSSFLKHIPNSLAYVRESLERQIEYKKLFEILKHYVPEFT